MNPRLPIIDIGGLRTDDPAAKSEVARQLHQACSDIGFFYVENHGVDDTLIEQCDHNGEPGSRPLSANLRSAKFV